jgi:hemerythrin superfamily protein
MTTQVKQQDVVDLLLQQHQQIKRMLSDVEMARGDELRDRFHELVRFLAVHESAEEMVVHPSARDLGDRAEAVVDSRLQEEKDAKEALAHLYDLGTDDPSFAARFSVFAASVVQHAEREEADEFPLLLREQSTDRLKRMARAVEAAQAIAPTRPHPNAGESAIANLLAGPPMAIFDRARDAIRDWQDKHRD